MDIRSSLVGLFASLPASLSLRCPLRSKDGQIGQDIVDFCTLKRLMGKHGSATMSIPNGVKAFFVIFRFQGGRISKVCRLRIQLINHATHFRSHRRSPVEVSIKSMAFVTEAFPVIDLPARFTVSLDCWLRR